MCTEAPIIIPVASGKGGTGKSMFTANLSMALAKLGHSTIAIDLDLGGSNLYSFLGIKNDFPGIGDYLLAKRGQLEELLVDTELSNLKFLPGDVQSPFMANIPYAQKIRLIRNLKKLPAKYIIIDLGSGSSFNTLDIFGVVNKGIMLTNFEHTAIINMLSFLKNFVFRIIERKIIKDKEERKLLRQTYKQTNIPGNITTKSLTEKISEINQDASIQVKKYLNDFRPRLVFNVGNHPNDLSIINQIEKSIEKVLLINVDYFGFILRDEHIQKTISQNKPLLSNFPNCNAAENIQIIADRIVRIWNDDLNNTAEILQKKTKEFYNK